jgi:hypothetical protein
MKKKSSFTVFLFLLTATLSAQDYLVTTKGDTVKGKAKILSFDPLDRVMMTGTNKQTFTAIQVRHLNMGNENLRPVRRENSIRFMKVIKPGYLSLLAFQPAGMGGWDGRYLSKVDGSGIEVPNLTFKKTMGKFLEDCPAIQEKLDKGELAKRDLEKIIDLYNACIQSKSDEKIANRTVEKKPVEKIENLEKVVAIKNLIEKVNKGDFLSKEDASDLLKDVLKKVEKGERIPNYLTEGLKSYLGNTPLNTDLENLLELLKK